MTFINWIKDIYEKSLANILLNGETLKTFPLKLETQKWYLFVNVHDASNFIISIVYQKNLKGKSRAALVDYISKCIENLMWSTKYNH